MKNVEPDKEFRGQGPAGTDRGPDAAGGRRCCRQGGQDHPAQALHRRYPASPPWRLAGKDDMPEDAERQGIGTRPPAPGFWKSWCPPVLWSAKRAKKTVISCPSPWTPFPSSPSCRSSCNPPADRRVGVPAGKRSSAASWPRRISWTGSPPCSGNWWGPISYQGHASTCSAPPREVVGRCPRCGGEIAEMQKGFFCQDKSCKFAIWKNNKWWEDEEQAHQGYCRGAAERWPRHVAGLYSEKTGKTYEPRWCWKMTRQYVNFKLELTSRKAAANEIELSAMNRKRLSSTTRPKPPPRSIPTTRGCWRSCGDWQKNTRTRS